MPYQHLMLLFGHVREGILLKEAPTKHTSDHHMLVSTIEGASDRRDLCWVGDWDPMHEVGLSTVDCLHRRLVDLPQVNLVVISFTVGHSIEVFLKIQQLKRLDGRGFAKDAFSFRIVCVRSDILEVIIQNDGTTGKLGSQSFRTFCFGFSPIIPLLYWWWRLPLFDGTDIINFVRFFGRHHLFLIIIFYN